MKTRIAALFAASLLLGTSFVGAQGGSTEDARKYFNFGVQAYDSGQYLDAVRAFEQAYRITPRAGLLFSIAQSLRREYYAKKNPDHLRKAIEHYRKYLEKAPDGGRKGEANQALAELEAISTRLSSELGEAPSAAPAAKPTTMLMVSSPTKGASVEIDGRRVGKPPFSTELRPGDHRVVVKAPGHHSVERVIKFADGAVVPLHLPLKEKAGRLRVVAPSGARISIDGSEVGEAPLAPVEVSPGRHFVAVVKNGTRPYTREIHVDRDEQRDLRTDMATSSQRVTSWVLMGTGAAALVTGGAFGLFSLKKQGDAEEILDRRSVDNISREDRDAYESARIDRDRFRAVSFITGGAGLALGATGAFLYLFDEPDAPTPDTESDRKRDEPSPVPGSSSMEVSAAPVFGPGAAGACLRGRF